MKLLRSHPIGVACLAVVFLFLAPSSGHAASGDMKLEAQLIWGTNDEKSPDPNHKAVEQDVERKLKKLPFKWKNYFEVTRKTLTVPRNGETKVALSKDCELRVRHVSGNTIEVNLIGKGQDVGVIKQSLPKGELLVTGGNAENLTSWFVVLRQVE
jgi:hypothetical protein